RKRLRVQIVCDGAVNNRNGQVRCGRESKKGEENHEPPRHPELREGKQWQSQNYRENDRYPTDVTEDSGSRAGANQPIALWTTISDLLLELAAAIRDKIITGLLLAIRSGIVSRRRIRISSRRVNRALHDFEFRVPRPSRQLFDCMPIAIASW